jgi:hypothetical protein
MLAMMTIPFLSPVVVQAGHTGMVWARPGASIGAAPSAAG